MTTFYLRILLVSYIFSSACSLMMAQSIRLNSSSRETQTQPNNLDPSDPILFAPAIPVYVSTGNPALDEARFLEMISRWNQHFPEQAINQNQIASLRNGNAQTIKSPRIKPASDPVAYRLLQEENLLPIWGHPDMPAVPEAKTENPGLAYQTWLLEVKQWVASSETLQRMAKGLKVQVYPYAQNPSADPDYPVYRDTGNPEADADRYHEQKLKYTEKLSLYSDK